MNVGTVRKVVLNCRTFDVPLDVDVTFNYSQYTIEGVATTGRTLQKRTKRVQTLEGLVIACSAAEMVDLAEMADSLPDKTFSIELADGSVFKTSGQINFENYTSAEGKANIQLIPTYAWTPFLA